MPKVQRLRHYANRSIMDVASLLYDYASDQNSLQRIYTRVVTIDDGLRIRMNKNHVHLGHKPGKTSVFVVSNSRPYNINGMNRLRHLLLTIFNHFSAKGDMTSHIRVENLEYSIKESMRQEDYKHLQTLGFQCIGNKIWTNRNSICLTMEALGYSPNTDTDVFKMFDHLPTNITMCEAHPLLTASECIVKVQTYNERLYHTLYFTLLSMQSKYQCALPSGNVIIQYATFGVGSLRRLLSRMNTNFRAEFLLSAVNTSCW